jgi:hypothetical protein
MVRPTKSNPGIGEYNSWTDLNGDGTVDIYDAITLADAYGTSGDSTRNVNVTNWPNGPSREDYYLEYWSYNISSEGWSSPTILCGGYSRLSLMARVTNTSMGPYRNVTVFLLSNYWMSTLYGPNPTCIEWLNTNVYNFTVYSDAQGSYLYSSIAPSYVIETKAPYYSADFAVVSDFGLRANWWVTFDICAYLRNE